MKLPWFDACDRTRRELYVLLQEYLPVFLLMKPAEIRTRMLADSQWVKVPDLSVWTAPPPLHHWQQAIEDLAFALPGNSKELGPFDPEAYKEFTCSFLGGFVPAVGTDCFRWVNGDLMWQINAPIDPPFTGRLFHDVGLPAPASTTPDSWLPGVKQRLMALSPDSCVLYNALCDTLPYIAYFDPAFAKLALDPRTWESVVEHDLSIDEARKRELRKIVGSGGYFGHVLNNALLHVFSAMVGNHFLAIADLLDHPAIHGGYTRLMPAYLFTVLLGKVEVLRNITQEMEIEE